MSVVELITLNCPHDFWDRKIAHWLEQPTSPNLYSRRPSMSGACSVDIFIFQQLEL